MSEPEKQCTLLEELDQRQDEALAQLEDLNKRIEELLRECLECRGDQQSMMEDSLDLPESLVRAAA